MKKCFICLKSPYQCFDNKILITVYITPYSSSSYLIVSNILLLAIIFQGTFSIIKAISTFVLIDEVHVIDVEVGVGVDGDTHVPDVGVDLPGLMSANVGI